MKRTSKKLTELELKKAQVKEKDYNLSDGDGLYFIERKDYIEIILNVQKKEELKQD